MIPISKNVQTAISETMRILNILDKKNAERFYELLDTADTEEDIIQLLINPVELYYDVNKESNRLIFNKIIKDEKIILQEQFHMPHHMVNEKGVGILTDKKVMAIPLYIRANAQIALKENKVATSDTQRDITGQVSGDESESGSFTDSEITCTIAQSADMVMKELLGPASHDLVAKKKAKEQLITTGEVRLSELPESSENKTSLLMFDQMMKAWGIDTDLVKTPLKP